MQKNDSPKISLKKGIAHRNKNKIRYNSCIYESNVIFALIPFVAICLSFIFEQSAWYRLYCSQQFSAYSNLNVVTSMKTINRSVNVRQLVLSLTHLEMLKIISNLWIYEWKVHRIETSFSISSGNYLPFQIICLIVAIKTSLWWKGVQMDGFGGLHRTIFRNQCENSDSRNDLFSPYSETQAFIFHKLFRTNEKETNRTLFLMYVNKFPAHTRSIQ